MKKADDRTVARVVLLNLLVLPGLGSLQGGRLFQGVGQIAAFMIGTIMLLIWLFKELSQYYGLMFGDEKLQAIGWIGEAGGFLCVVSWLWALVTSFKYYRAIALQSSGVFLGSALPPMPKLPDPQLASALKSIPLWSRQGAAIARTFQFNDFPSAMKFINAVADLAEQTQHHPDMDIRWNRVTLALTTHDAGGVTNKDIILARRCDALSLR